MRQPDFRAAHSPEIAEASLPFLASDSPELLGGVVAARLGASHDNVPRASVEWHAGEVTAQSIARQLIAIGDPAGFRFAARSIEQ
jgi:hypothetical protein